jgi:hypothetical protein
MADVEDPAEKDESVPTDNILGMQRTPSVAERFTGTILPEMPVGRIPTTDVEVVRAVVEQGQALAPNWTNGLALTAAVWRNASEAVLARIARAGGPGLLVAPPAHEGLVAKRMSAMPARVYFNVHGSDQEAVWLGEEGGRYPPVLRPAAVNSARSAVVVSEACYGAAMFEGEPSIGATFLQRGAGCFVGSTIVAWGPPDPPPRLADLIAVGFFENLDRGHPAGSALLAAKEAILEERLERGESLSPQEHNTLLSFVLFGHPLAKIAGPPGPTKASLLANQPGASSVLSNVRSSMAGSTSSAIGSVRRRLQDRMNPADWQALSRGRVQFATLAAKFTNGRTLCDTIEHMLGEVPSEVSEFHYRCKALSRVCITATANVSWGRRKVAVVVDPRGAVVERWVTR